VQQADAGVGQPALPFDRKGAEQLVLGGLGGSIGIPAPEAVIADAADPRRQAGEMQRPLALQQGFEGLGQQDRPEGVHSEAALKVGAPQPGQPFFRLELGPMQQAGGVDHQPQRRQRGQSAGQGLKAAVMREIQTQGQGRAGKDPRAAGPVGSNHDQPGCTTLQGRDQPQPDAAAAHHQSGAAPLIEGLSFRCSCRWCSGIHVAHDGETQAVLMTLTIAMLGLGAWGRTLAGLWERQGHRLIGWSRRQGGDPAPLLLQADLVAIAVAMEGIEPLAAQLAPVWPRALPLLSCSKGIDPARLATPVQLWRRHLPEAPLLVLSGPNLAGEMAAGLPAASVIASTDQDRASWLQRQLRGESLRLYSSDDPIGVEAAAALKNVMAVAAGICDGLGLGANAKASLLCRGLAEMGVVVQGMGGQPASLYGLAGLGDLLATANSPLSRNYRCGLLLAEGLDEAAAITRIDATVEGPRTARAALALAARQGWSLPICDQVLAVLEGRTTAALAVQALMQRGLKREWSA
jgi:glycerol-3-phosphate dehydrogenase (NAD(P)+)